ncbi:Lipid II flippase MurJ [subsurface metagenome]
MKTKNIWVEAKSGIKSVLNKIKARPLVRDTITTTIFSTTGKGIGFLIPFFIAAWFGVTSGTDAFFFAYGLILFISSIFAPVVQSIIVPYIAEARAKNEDVGSFVGKILGISGIGLAGLSGIFLLLIRPFLSLITHFDPASLNLIYILMLETIPLIVLLVWTSILAGSLNAYKKFAVPALSPAFRAGINLAIIFSLRGTLGIHAIAWGYVIGEIFRAIILLSAIHKFKLFSPHFSINLDPKLKRFFKTASYQMLGMVAVGLNPVVDKTMASWLGEGSVSVLHYADRLYIIPVTFISSGLMVTLLSHWSGRYYEFGQERLKRDLKKAIKIVGFLALIIAVGLISLSQFIVKLAFGRGAFVSERLIEVRWIWICYLLGFVPYMFSQLFIRRHLILKQTDILFLLSLLWNSLNIVLNLIFMHFMGIAGIALSTSTVYTIASIILFSIFKSQLKNEHEQVLI